MVSTVAPNATISQQHLTPIPRLKFSIMCCCVLRQYIEWREVVSWGRLLGYKELWWDSCAYGNFGYGSICKVCQCTQKSQREIIKSSWAIALLFTGCLLGRTRCSKALRGPGVLCPRSCSCTRLWSCLLAVVYVSLHGSACVLRQRWLAEKGNLKVAFAP